MNFIKSFSELPFVISQSHHPDLTTQTRTINHITNMSGTGFDVTKEDIRKLEAKESKKHGGDVPKDSDVSKLKVGRSVVSHVDPDITDNTQSLVDSKTDKQSEIDERKANLPLPDQPPVASDWNSADARTVNVGSGGISDDFSAGKASSGGLRGPATADSSVRTDGDEFKTNTAP